MPEIGNISPYFSLLGEASAITGLKTTTPIIPCARDPDTVVGAEAAREAQRGHQWHVEDDGEVAEDPGAVVMCMHKGVTETTFSLKCLKDKLFTTGATVLVIALLIAIALAARKCPSCPSPILPTCSENGIGFREKCFYFVQNETNWNESQSFCLSLGAQLATIDSQEDLNFLLRYGHASHYWVGLHREGSNPWRWCNGSLFNNLFDIQGNGQCAYIDLDGVSSDWCSQLKYLVCSHPLKSPRGA